MEVLIDKMNLTIHHFNRQRAKSHRFKADNLTIKIKGLGTDHQRFGRDLNGNYPDGFTTMGQIWLI